MRAILKKIFGKARNKFISPVLIKLNEISNTSQSTNEIFANQSNRLQELSVSVNRIISYIENDKTNNEFYIQIKGLCPICDSYATFFSTNENLRENLLCPNCGSITRERAMMVVIDKHMPDWRERVIFESSPCDRGISKHMRLEAKGYICAQYYPDNKLKDVVNGFRNEDLENLTFSDESLDLIITQDVLEHLFDPEKAFREISRVLKPGGMHIFTIPIASPKKTVVWAKKGPNGEPQFLYNEEWHGNPISEQGSACTMHYGYDIVEKIKENGGMDTIIEYLFDLRKGITHGSMNGIRSEVFISKKHL